MLSMTHSRRNLPISIIREHHWNKVVVTATAIPREEWQFFTRIMFSYPD